MKMFIVDNEVKCLACNWRARLYAYAESQEAADELYEDEDAGLCGDCMCDLLVEAEKVIV